MVIKRERKGPKGAQKEGKIYYVKFLKEIQISLRGYNTTAKKGREIKVCFTFDMAEFSPARSVDFINSIPSTSG